MVDAVGLTLRLNRVLPAARERVWGACTEPHELARWWGPHGFTTPHVDLDLRVGGRYRFAMQPPDGEVFHLTGEFLRVDRPSLLEYTFRWDPPDPADRETIATVSLEDLGDSTRFRLQQVGFATEERHVVHESGWTDSLERLQDFVSSQGRDHA